MLKAIQTEEIPTFNAPPTLKEETGTSQTEMADKRTEFAVAEFLKQMKRRARRGRRTLNTALFLLFVPVVIGLFLIMINGVQYGASAALLMGAGAVVTLLYSLVCLIFTEIRGATKDIEELERACGVKAIGPLLEMRNTFLTPAQQKVIFHALIRLLPQMKASDVNLLSPKQYESLYSTLKSGGGDSAPLAYLTEFRLAILKALEQVGDERAIPAVQRVANTPAFLPTAKRLREAAERCLPLLQSNHQTIEATKTLLRASSAEQASPETLLRAAEFMPDAAPGELLRAADANAAPRP